MVKTHIAFLLLTLDMDHSWDLDFFSYPCYISNENQGHVCMPLVKRVV